MAQAASWRSNSAATENTICAIDVGNSKTSCVIANIPPIGSINDIDVLGAGQFGISLSDHRNDRLAASEKSIRAAVELAEKMANVRVGKVITAVPGRMLQVRRTGADLRLGGAGVTQEDVFRCLTEGTRLNARDGLNALHTMPVKFAIDGYDVGNNPCGFSGGVLSTELVSVSMRGSIEENMAALFDHCDVLLDRCVAAPIASSEAVLVEDEKELGCIAIDLGARSIDYAVYQSGALVSCGGISVGCDLITRDIAQIFGCSLAHAERSKTVHGSALSGMGDDHRFIEFPQLGDDADVSQASKADVSAVIASRLEEIFALVLEDARRVHARGTPVTEGVRRAVLTGGGSLLTGARETADRVFGVKSRLGKPQILSGAPDVVRAPQFAVCVGMLLLETRYRNGWLPETHAGLFQMEPAHNISAGIFGGVTRWLRANF